MSIQEKIKQVVRPDRIKDYFVMGKFSGQHAVVCEPKLYRGLEQNPVIEPGQYLVGIITMHSYIYNTTVEHDDAKQHTIINPQLFFGTTITNTEIDERSDRQLTNIDSYDLGSQLAAVVYSEMKEKVDFMRKELKKHEEYGRFLKTVSNTRFPTSTRDWKGISYSTIEDLLKVCIVRNKYEKAEFLKKILPIVYDEPMYPIIKKEPDKE